MIAEGKYQPVSGIKNLVKEYTESTYKIDRYYRYFYFYFDKLEDTTQFEKKSGNWLRIFIPMSI